MFSIKKKKSNQNKKIVKNVINIVQFSIALHCCIQSLHLLHFKIKVACIGIPKNHVHKCIDFSVYTVFQNLMSYILRMRGPLKKSTSCFLIRLNPLVLVPISLCHRTQSSLLSFIGLKVLAFIFHRTQSPRLFLSRGSTSS